VIITHFVWI